MFACHVIFNHEKIIMYSVLSLITWHEFSLKCRWCLKSIHIFVGMVVANKKVLNVTIQEQRKYLLTLSATSAINFVDIMAF